MSDLIRIGYRIENNDGDILDEGVFVFDQRYAVGATVPFTIESKHWGNAHLVQTDMHVVDLVPWTHVYVVEP